MMEEVEAGRVEAIVVKDTSRKIKSVFKAKGMTGKHMSGQVPYGYLWADEKREQWIIDGEGVNKSKPVKDPCGWCSSTIDQETFDNVLRTTAGTAERHFTDPRRYLKIQICLNVILRCLPQQQL